MRKLLLLSIALVQYTDTIERRPNGRILLTINHGYHLVNIQCSAIETKQSQANEIYILASVLWLRMFMRCSQPRAPLLCVCIKILITFTLGRLKHAFGGQTKGSFAYFGDISSSAPAHRSRTNTSSYRPFTTSVNTEIVWQFLALTECRANGISAAGKCSPL